MSRMKTSINRLPMGEGWFYHRVTLGQVSIVFKNDNVIAVESPTEIFITEPVYKVVAHNRTFSMKNGKWALTQAQPQLVDPEAIIVHMNRLLWKQADDYISKKIKSRLKTGSKA